jgi:hypothetical protein
MRGFWEARLSDLGAGDLVAVECLGCGHVEMLTATSSPSSNRGWGCARIGAGSLGDALKTVRHAVSQQYANHPENDSQYRERTEPRIVNRVDAEIADFVKRI